MMVLQPGPAVRKNGSRTVFPKKILIKYYLAVVEDHLSIQLDGGIFKHHIDVEDEILKEYRKEFWGEGQLWFYYKRKGITNFSEFMTDASLFTFEIPDIETSYGGRD